MPFSQFIQFKRSVDERVQQSRTDLVPLLDVTIKQGKWNPTFVISLNSEHVATQQTNKFMFETSAAGSMGFGFRLSHPIRGAITVIAIHAQKSLDCEVTVLYEQTGMNLVHYTEQVGAITTTELAEAVKKYLVKITERLWPDVMVKP